jgi:peptide/nickel transport system substrate-binding protein
MGPIVVAGGKGASKFGRRGRLGVAAALLAALTFICWSTATSSASPRAKAAAGGQLIVGDSQAPTSFDPDGPAANLIANLNGDENVYAPLLTLGTVPNPLKGGGGGQFINPSKFVPVLATSWKRSGNTWTFNLRHGVKAANGDPFTAADEVYTYQRSLALKATGAFLWGVFIKAKSVTAKGPYTLQIVTNGPAPMMLDTLALAAPMWPIDAIAAEKQQNQKDPNAANWLSSHSAGFGPFSLTSYTPSQSAVFTPNPHYFGPKPTKSVKLIAIPDSATRFSSLQQGAIDVALNLTPQQVTQAGHSKKEHVFSFKGNSNASVYLNLDVPQLVNPLVRQAMWYATPSEQIIKSVYAGHAFLFKSEVPPDVPGYTDKYYTYSYNIAKAKSLMSQAGLSGGFSTTLYYATNDAPLAAIATILQASWSQIGINVTLQAEPQASLVTQSFGQKNLPVYLLDTASQIFPDGTEFGALYSSGGFANTTHYVNAAFDSAFTASNSTWSNKQILAATDAMQKATMASPIYIPVAGLTTNIVTNSSVKNWVWDPSQAEHWAPAVTPGG